uniref:NADH-ubiquinone oxidoreductase chain 2 n=1 Tax=Thryonomys swinderianus TaxID=10169 RepID=Q9B6G1_THRSW|nr:NADH dehydrogenase subunit 2 [Thryonomys swinderianus]CAC27800.1 NADH dehydrogenase subunit 2 [Thryonomys swinderianus]
MNIMPNIILYSTLIMGTLITITSSHWILMWVGLEMGMFAMIPIMMDKKNPRSTEAATKYFLTQTTASMMLLMSIILTMLYSGNWEILHNNNLALNIIPLLALAMKMGLAPFHLWVPEVMQGIPLMAGMILLTWQKIAPLIIMIQIAPSLNNMITLSLAIMSILMGGWGGLNQTQLRKIMAYSSISHMGWMTAIMIYSTSIVLINLTIYIVLTLPMFMMFMYFPNTNTLTLSLNWNSMPLMTMLTLTVLLSLGGLPPLTGFLPKWMIIQEMINNNSITMPVTMAIMALLNLFFYMRLVYSTTLTLFPSTNNLKFKWTFQPSTTMPMITPLIIISTLLLPLAPIVTFLN